MATQPLAPDAPADLLTDTHVDPLSDARLVDQMMAGSEDALASLYDRHVNAVFGAAVRASGDRSIAAEVVQDTFLTLWNRAELFDPSRGSLSSWLLTIARNRAIDRLRAAGRNERANTFSSFGRIESDGYSVAEWLTASGELVGAAGPEPVPEIALSNKEERASIEAAVASLDPVERHVIVLAYGEGLTQSEIAATLGWPIGTVKTRTRRALRHLRDRLERPEAAGPGEVAGAHAGTRGFRGSTHAKPAPVRVGDCFAPC
jgi:RNA polymerase sigma-70 factor (ECF subfamily)